MCVAKTGITNVKMISNAVVKTVLWEKKINGKMDSVHHFKKSMNIHQLGHKTKVDKQTKLMMNGTIQVAIQCFTMDVNLIQTVALRYYATRGQVSRLEHANRIRLSRFSMKIMNGSNVSKTGMNTVLKMRSAALGSAINSTLSQTHHQIGLHSECVFPTFALFL